MSFLSDLVNQAKQKANELQPSNIGRNLNNALKEGQRQLNANWQDAGRQFNENLDAGNRLISEGGRRLGQNITDSGLANSALRTGAGTPWAAGNKNTWWDYTRGFLPYTNPVEIADKYKKAKENWDAGNVGPADYVGLSLQGGHGASLDLGATERENADANTRAELIRQGEENYVSDRKREYEKAEQDRINKQRDELLLASNKATSQNTLQDAMFGALNRRKRGRQLWGA